MISDKKEAVLETFVGSCVALCLHDNHVKLAGVAHIMLPESINGIKSPNPQSAGKFADQAIHTMIDMMVRRGAKISRLRAKMVGGANMFAHEGGESLFNIGPRNIEAIKILLKKRGIPLILEETGKNYGRRVQFAVESGNLTVRSKANRGA